VADIATHHHLAEFSRNLGVVKGNERLVARVVRKGRHYELSNTDQDEEDNRTREHEGEERFTNAAIVPEAEEQCLVEQFS